MTTEEAIKILSDVGDINRCCAEDAEALDMAIKALDQQTCEDCISRKTELDGLASIAKAKAKSDAQKALMGRVMYFTEQLPPVKPKYTDEEIDRAQAVEQAYIDKMVELRVEELKRPKGKWISRWYGDKNFHVCSECSEEFSCDMETGIGIDNYCYCPKCGAKLRQEDS